MKSKNDVASQLKVKTKGKKALKKPAQKLIELSEFIDQAFYEEGRNTPLPKMGAELKNRVKELDKDQSRSLLDLYYQIQRTRKGAGNQRSALKREVDYDTVAGDSMVTEWSEDYLKVMESQLKMALEVVGKSTHLGKWVTTIHGIGPIIATTLLAHIAMERVQTVGDVWNFSGMNPEKKWLKGQKRPWCARMKQMCYFVGESFVKVSGNPDAFYGQLYLERKKFEIDRNDSGENRQKAIDKAREIRKSAGETGSDALKWYDGCFKNGDHRRLLEVQAEVDDDQITQWQAEAKNPLTPAQIKSKIQVLTSAARLQWVKDNAGPVGSGDPMLPPGHVHGQARRWVVKIWLYHVMQIWMRIHSKGERELPLPWVIEHGGHAHMIECPYPWNGPDFKAL